MICAHCNSEVSCLNDTSDGEACYNCIKRLGLKIIPYKIKKINLENEFMTKEQFVLKQINKKIEETR